MLASGAHCNMALLAFQAVVHKYLVVSLFLCFWSVMEKPVSS